MKADQETPQRILSIDLFRGLTVAGMILVNNPGSWSHMYWPLKHAKWNGCTPTDLVFPFFLIAVGLSIPFSVGNGFSEFYKILKRAAILIFLGLFLNFFGEWSLAELRIPGVLQRIGFTYFFCAILYRQKNLLFRGTLFFGILIGYWLLLSFVSPPGGDTPTLSEGKDWGAWLDRTVFGEKHLWRFSKVWDPEGLLSSVSAVASVMLGTFLGEYLKASLQKGKRVSHFVLFFAIVSGVLFLAGGFWGIDFPINKSLWTSSYVLWTGGYAAATISFFFLLEIRKTFVLGFAEKFFLPFGRNALLVFFGSGIFARSLNIIEVIGKNGKNTSLKNYIYSEYYKSWINSPELSSFAYSLTVLSIWFLILYALDRKRLYWRV